MAGVLPVHHRFSRDRHRTLEFSTGRGGLPTPVQGLPLHLPPGEILVIPYIKRTYRTKKTVPRPGYLSLGAEGSLSVHAYSPAVES